MGGFSGLRVLVTGGAGFIGTALARRHAGSAADWVALDNLLPQVHGDDPPSSVAPGVTLVRADVRDREAVTAVVRDLHPDVVVHLAAETGTGQSLNEPSRHTDVNVTGTAVLFEALSAAAAPGRVVLTSSRAVYGEGAWRDSEGRSHYPGPRTASMLAAGQWDFPGLTSDASAADRTVPHPSNIYGATKLAQEHLLTAWASARGVATSILRLQNVYGPGQSPINPYTGITTLFLRLALAGEALPVYEDGRIVRDFVYIDDVVRALTAAAAADGDVLADVGSGRACTIGQMADVVAAICSAPAPVVTGQYRLGDVRAASCDMHDSGWLLAGRAPLGLEEGLTRLRDWYVGRAAV